MNKYMVTTYNTYIQLNKTELIYSDSAENAIKQVADRKIMFFTKNAQWDPSEFIRDNAHTQFDGNGCTGIYANRIS